ncbi:MAG: hypothetical protein JWQ81_84, partial [Amycolatopsis sp.]|uniref:DUF222 domain-containing protein n=1 Tax=Amycolatopsis sp. TaxID=37632 RepID=UPI0026099E7D
MTSTGTSTTPTEWWRVDGPVLVTEYINLEENRRRAEAEQGRILAEIKRRGVRDTTGYGTLPALIRDTVHVSTTDALARVKRSEALHPGCDLTGTPTAPLAPATADAAREGVIGNAQIDAITSILGKIPATVSDHDREQAEKILVGLA